jgi:hypothetical protein
MSAITSPDVATSADVTYRRRVHDAVGDLPVLIVGDTLTGDYESVLLAWRSLETAGVQTRLELDAGGHMRVRTVRS